MVLDRADSAAERDPDHDGEGDGPAGAVAHLGELADDLVERGEDEAVKLDLAHRPVAAQRQADRGADDARLGQRGIDHAMLAEVLLQSVRHPEDAAELADILAHDHYLGVGLERLAQPRVERLGESDRAHRAASVPATATPASSNPDR